MGEILVYIFEILGHTVGILLFFSLLFSIQSSAFQIVLQKSFSSFSNLIIYPFVIIHEMGHLIFAIIFTQKVHEVKLLSFRTGTTLGYVKMSKVPTNSKIRKFYQNMGDFFIGFAPIIVGSGLFAIIFRLLKPEISKNLWEFSLNSSNGIAFLKQLFTMDIYKYLFSFDIILIIIILFMVASLVNLSEPDWKCGLNGLNYFVIFLIGFIIIFHSFSWFEALSFNVIAISKYVSLLLLYVSFYGGILAFLFSLLPRRR